ncbi:MAG: TonB-dependent receptor family protein [Bacillota bacterium]
MKSLLLLYLIIFLPAAHTAIAQTEYNLWPKNNSMTGNNVISGNYFITEHKDNDSITYYLNQVTITATRYPENLLEIPYAVSILNKEQLNSSRGYGIDEALRQVPGVLAQSRSGNQDIRLTIRGFGARGAGDRSNAGTSRGIKVLLDGFPETEPDGRTSFDLIDPNNASSIEVIRSNASALWGNASGGVINISTVPIATTPFLEASTIAGAFGLRNYMFSAGTAFSNGNIYASFTNNNFEGWRHHSNSYRSLFNAGIISNLSPGSVFGVHITAASNMFHIPGPLTQSQFESDPSQANLTYLTRDERRFNRTGRIGLSLDHLISEQNEISAMLFVNPKYLQRSERGTFRDFTRYHTGGNIIYRNKADVSSVISNSFTAGADEAYQDGAILFYSLSPTNGRGNTLRDNKGEGANNFGAFLQNEIIFNEKLSLIIGGRYDIVSYFYENYLSAANNYQTKSFRKFTPKAGISYRISPVHSIYANLGGGVEVPAGNETDPAGTYGQDTVYLINPLLEPVSSTTFELGSKHIIIPDSDILTSFSYDMALYYIDINNDIIPYRGGRFYFTAGRTYRTGLELGSSIDMFSFLRLQSSLSYSINKYKEYKVDSLHYDLKKAGRFADFSGNKTAGLPDIFYNLGLRIYPEFFHGGFLNFELNGIGKYFADDANKITVPAFSLINAQIGIKPVKITKNLFLKALLSINNLTDIKYASSAFVNPDILNGVPVFLEPGLPRNLSFSIFLGVD